MMVECFHDNQKNVQVRFMQSEQEQTILQDIPVIDSDGFDEFSKNWFGGCFVDTLRMYFWKERKEQNYLDFADCVISSQNRNFRAHISVISRSCKFVANMIKDLKLSYSYDNPVDLSNLFQEFSSHDVFMFLCFIYNPQPHVDYLDVLVAILKIAVKLQSQDIINKILAQEDLVYIFHYQNEYDESTVKGDGRYDIVQINNFAIQHDLTEICLICNLIILNYKNESYSRNIYEQLNAVFYI
eukprot:TRINITY_DN5912_c0_g1_i10.p1 TRINITY_DN5912_c0_g1~~TRINITY_DN5912_c0_g1_i10.p1  ORF type:complete len:263 (+),score=2.53 TRINITY_DN5912_c0_g1_i10:67-789(+)